MLNNLKIRLLPVLLFILFPACVPMAKVEIRVMDPAQITLPSYLRDLVFINRSILSELTDPDSTWTPEEHYVLDTLMNNWIIRGIQESMKESPLFRLDTFRVILARRDERGSLDRILTPGEIDRIKKVVPDADALISLEYFILEDSVRVDISLGEYGYKGYLGLYTRSLWRIYDLSRDTVVDECRLKDVVDWMAGGDTQEHALQNLPKMIDAIRVAGHNMGLRYGERISPAWIKADRYYHIGGCVEMRQAGRHIASGEWEAASGIWRILASDPVDRVAARACFNMALYSESEDQLVPALDWAIKSYAIRQESLTREYINLLRKRFDDRKKLGRQLRSQE